MLDQLGALLSGNKTVEAAVVFLGRRVGHRDRAPPLDAVRLREEPAHQALDIRQLDVDVAITNLGRTATIAAVLEVEDDVSSFFLVFDLDIAVHGLASTAIHDNVDGIEGTASRLRDDTRVATDGGDNLGLGAGIWDPQEVSDTMREAR